MLWQSAAHGLPVWHPELGAHASRLCMPGHVFCKAESALVARMKNDPGLKA